MVDNMNFETELQQVEVELVEIDVQIQNLRKRKLALQNKRSKLKEFIASHSNQINTNIEFWEKEDFEWSSKLRDCLQSRFGMNSFRPIQLSAMNAFLSRENCILIMSTGGGKSLCYQLPAVLRPGFTLVVSPLVALMEDQVISLETFGIECAMLNASCSKEELQRIQTALINVKSGLKLVFVTPEKLAKSKRFMAKLEKAYELGLFDQLVVDECHCCSHWGHDFRVDYKFLSIVKRQFPNVPILALTATATERVIEDVKSMLSIPGALVFRTSFNRTNLFYSVRPKPIDSVAMLNDMSHLIQTKFAGQSGIIYCYSRREAEDVAVGLQSKGFSAACYHADMSTDDRSSVHRQWIENKIQLVVATIAFGMGIDKSDVRFVIHHSLPKSLDSFYQESGRAGRDGQRAECLLYFKFSDVFRQSVMVYEEKNNHMEHFYSMLAYCHNIVECRRKLIANHFGETFENSYCQQMCDNCCRYNSNGAINGLNEINVIEDYQQICRHLNEHKINFDSQKMTFLKLLDVWCKSTQKPKSFCERVLIHLLLNDYIQEFFHFTAYRIISYIIINEHKVPNKSEPILMYNVSTNQPVPAQKRKSHQQNVKGNISKKSYKIAKSVNCLEIDLTD